jgi:hypothetical protein
MLESRNDDPQTFNSIGIHVKQQKNKPFLPDFAGNSQHGFVQNSIGAPHSLIASSMIGGAGL